MSAAFLTAQGVSVRLSGRTVLNDVSLALSPGHLVALVGPNGAGKTTLLRAFAGLVPSDGAIHVGGDALALLSLRHRARRSRMIRYRKNGTPMIEVNTPTLMSLVDGMMRTTISADINSALPVSALGTNSRVGS